MDQAGCAYFKALSMDSHIPEDTSTVDSQISWNLLDWKIFPKKPRFLVEGEVRSFMYVDEILFIWKAKQDYERFGFTPWGEPINRWIRTLVGIYQKLSN
jgi:hypothetical protein